MRCEVDFEREMNAGWYDGMTMEGMRRGFKGGWEAGDRVGVDQYPDSAIFVIINKSDQGKLG